MWTSNISVLSVPSLWSVIQYCYYLDNPPEAPWIKCLGELKGTMVTHSFFVPDGDQTRDPLITKPDLYSLITHHNVKAALFCQNAPFAISILFCAWEE